MAGRGSFRKRSYRGRGHGRFLPVPPEFTPNHPSANRSSIPPNHATSFKRSEQTSSSSFRPSSSRALAITSDVVCTYCHEVGHTLKGCWRANGQCFRCGSHDHKVATCPRPTPDRQQSSSRRPLSAIPVSQRAPVSQQTSDSSTQRGPPLPSQKQAYQNRQRFKISVEENQKKSTVITG